MTRVPALRQLQLLFAMRLTGLRNSVVRNPAQYLLGTVLLALVYWGLFTATRRGVRFVFGFLMLGNTDIAEAVIQRSLESFFLISMLGVAFSVLTTAIHTLYSSEDLPFLLSQPVSATQVFHLKVAETYMSAALMPAFFTLPVLMAVGIERQAMLAYYPLAFAAVLALYALPVVAGCLIALLLMRVAPAGRVKEVATGLSVILAAALIFGLRFLRPERLTTMSMEEMNVLLRQLASFEIGWLPTSWTSQAVWGALEGRVTGGAYLLAVLSLLSLSLVAWLAAIAYKEGWIRALDSKRPKLDPRNIPAPYWERRLQAFGHTGAIISKDLRLLLRDPTQWSQLLVLIALAGVYLVSIGSIQLEGFESQRFRDAIGTMNIMFMGFLLSGVGIRMAYPIVSLEGEGFWLLRTGPLRARQIVMSKFWHTLPIMAILGTGLGVAAARLIDVSPSLAFVSPFAGLCAAVATTGLGVGLGAAFPRFNATSPSEIPMAAGGLLYMALSLLYALLMTLLLVWPAWRTLQNPSLFIWSTLTGQLLLLSVLALTLITTLTALLFGSHKLEWYEPGR